MVEEGGEFARDFWGCGMAENGGGISPGVFVPNIFPAARAGQAGVPVSAVVFRGIVDTLVPAPFIEDMEIVP